MAKPLKIRQKRVDQFIQDFEAECEFAESYVTSEDSCLAEFVSDFGYGEGDVNLDRLDDDIKPLVVEFLQSHSKKQLSEFCTIELVGVHYQDNEVFGAVIGEQEHQLSDELDGRFKKFNSLEREHIERMCCIRGSWFYTSHDYDRFVLVLDVDRFTEEYKPVPTKPKLTVIQGEKILTHKTSAPKLTLVGA